MSKILIIVGSKSDIPKLEKYLPVATELGLEYEVKVASAHRDPSLVTSISSNASKDGYKVIIAGAGLAAALPGVVAAHTELPVIGVPISAGALNGLDALYAIVQMPPGVPVGSMGIDNFKNAFIYAAQMIGLNNTIVCNKLKKLRNL